MSPLSATCDASLLALVLCAAFSDARTGLIPNTLTLPCLALGPLAHLVFGGPGAFLFSLCAALACGLVPLLMFRLRAMGGGDVKLLAAIGGLSGMQAGIEIQLLGYLVATGFALIALWRTGLLAQTLHGALLRLVPFGGGNATRIATEQPTQRLGVPVLIATAWVLGSRLVVGGLS